MTQYQRLHNAQFTEYFSEYLETHELPEEFALMPSDDNGITFANRFIARNLFKEIGAETEELFTLYLTSKIQEIVAAYKWKIEMYVQQRDALMQRQISLASSNRESWGGSDTLTETQNLTDTESGKDKKSDGTTNKELFNPLTDASDTLVNKNTSDTESETDYGHIVAHTGTDTNTTEYAKVISNNGTTEKTLGVFKSNAELLRASLEIDNLYNEALEKMDVLFMGIL